MEREDTQSKTSLVDTPRGYARCWLGSEFSGGIWELTCPNVIRILVLVYITSSCGYMRELSWVDWSGEDLVSTATGGAESKLACATTVYGAGQDLRSSRFPRMALLPWKP